MEQKQTILITGTTRGIGLATALRLLDEGYRVIGTSVSGTNQHINDPNFTILKLDLTSEHEIRSFPARLSVVTDHIDILINNAGAGGDVMLIEPDAKMFRHTFDVNVCGLVQFTEAILPLVRDCGHIWILSSAMSLIDRIEPNGPAYRMSKAAVNVYMKMLAQRLQDREIKVNALEPGWVKTDMGGNDAPVSPEEAASFIYFAISTSERTGCFWLSDDKTGYLL